jgi:hypothetical protein
VHIHSNSISNARLFKKFDKALLQPQEIDRSGGPSNNTFVDIVNRLKEIHATRFRAQGIHWMNWANYILAQPPAEHERLMQAAPPGSMLPHFHQA